MKNVVYLFLVFSVIGCNGQKKNAAKKVEEPKTVEEPKKVENVTNNQKKEEQVHTNRNLKEEKTDLNKDLNQNNLNKAEEQNKFEKMDLSIEKKNNTHFNSEKDETVK